MTTHPDTDLDARLRKILDDRDMSVSRVSLSALHDAYALGQEDGDGLEPIRKIGDARWAKIKKMLLAAGMTPDIHADECICDVCLEGGIQKALGASENRDKVMGEPEFEKLAVIGLNAWNGVTDHFAWPADFPEGSRAAWHRVVAAIYAAATGAKPVEGPLAHDGLTVSKSCDPFEDKREGRTSPAAPDTTINLLPDDFEQFIKIVEDASEANNPLLTLLRGYTVVCQHGHADNERDKVIEECAGVADAMAICKCGRSDCYSDNIPKAAAFAIRALKTKPPASPDGDNGK